jgi:hypothetical protein
MRQKDAQYHRTTYCEYIGFDLIAFIDHSRINYSFTYQEQTSDAPSKSSTVAQDLRPPHFVQIVENVFFPLSFLFLGSLNDFHINTVSLQRGYSEDIAIYIDYYGKYETIPFGIIQRLNQSSKSHLHFRISEQFAHNNQL